MAVLTGTAAVKHQLNGDGIPRGTHPETDVGCPARNQRKIAGNNFCFFMTLFPQAQASFATQEGRRIRHRKLLGRRDHMRQKIIAVFKISVDKEVAAEGGDLPQGKIPDRHLRGNAGIYRQSKTPISRIKGPEIESNSGILLSAAPSDI